MGDTKNIYQSHLWSSKLIGGLELSISIAKYSWQNDVLSDYKHTISYSVRCWEEKHQEWLKDLLWELLSVVLAY